MPSPLVVAALISAGTSLLKRPPPPEFRPASFGKVPAPTFRPPSQQGQSGKLRSMVMDAFLQRQLGLGTTSSANVFAPPRRRLPEFREAQSPSFNPIFNPIG